MRRARQASVIVLLAVMAGLMAWEAFADSLTADEVYYIRGGYCAITSGIIDLERTNPSGPKLLAGAAVLLLGPAPKQRCDNSKPRFFYAIETDQLRWLIFVGRLPNIVLSLVLGGVVFLWARAMAGYVAGLAALVLLVFEPTVLAHGHLATGDLPVSLGILACLAAYWRRRATGARRWLILSGAGMGLALLAKVSALYLLPILLAIEAYQWWRSPIQLGRGVRALASVTGVAWLVVCLVYLPFHTINTTIHLPAPLSWVAPPSWLYGVGYQLRHVTAGTTYNYLNGQVRIGKGFWEYFAEALALKSTLGFLALGVIAILLTYRHRLRDVALFLWLPAAVIFLAATVGGIDIGVRYILPLYPLVAVAIGCAVASSARSPGRAVPAVALLLAAVISSLGHAPNHIGYFNELAGSTPEQYLSDSNLDWGQDAWRLHDWWADRGSPALQTAYFGGLPLSYYGIDSRSTTVRVQPAPGLVAVSLTELTSYGFDEVGAYAVMRLCPTSVGRIGTSIQPLLVSIYPSTCPVAAVR